MMRLIDADALIGFIVEEARDLRTLSTKTVGQAISKAPTVDAVPVIRCRDCKHMHEDGAESYCDDSGRYIDGTGFCKWAERKDNETD